MEYRTAATVIGCKRPLKPIYVSVILVLWKIFNLWSSKMANYLRGRSWKCTLLKTLTTKKMWFLISSSMLTLQLRNYWLQRNFNYTQLWTCNLTQWSEEFQIGVCARGLHLLIKLADTNSLENPNECLQKIWFAPNIVGKLTLFLEFSLTWFTW